LIARPRARFDLCRRVCGVALALALASGCGDDAANKALEQPRSDDFGHEVAPFPLDAGGQLDGGGQSPGDGDGDEVVVRFVHAMVNVGTLYVCHDPDLVLDDPESPQNEEVLGPEEPVVLALETAFGVTDAVAVPAKNSGTLTVHLRPPPALLDDAGTGVPDAAVAQDSAVTDAGLAVPECSPETRVAALELAQPTTPATPEDAGGPTGRSALSSGPLLLVASGVALSKERLDARAAQAQDEYWAANPEDGTEAGAQQAGRYAVAQVQATLGPTLRLEGDPGANLASDSFRVSLTQLTPDVTGSGVGPGAVRVCVTAGTLEKVVEPPAQTLPIAFRNRFALTPVFKPALKYRFRVFPASKFDPPPGSNGNMGGQDCATTGLAPLAELFVDEDQLKAGQALELLLMGAVAPTPLCSPVEPNSFVRAGCPLNPSELGARLVLCSTERCFTRAP
jgi:hypothetical protein